MIGEQVALGSVSLGLGIAMLIGCPLVIGRNAGPRVVKITKERVTLWLPSVEAAAAINARFPPTLAPGLPPPCGRSPGSGARPLQPGLDVLDGATCPTHDTPAVGTCVHCGDFLCGACAHRPPGMSVVFCAECLERRDAHMRAEKLGPPGGNGLATAALVFGVLSLIPMGVAFWLGGLMTGFRGLKRAEELGGLGRTRALVGLWLVLVGFVGTVLIFGVGYVVNG